ncbi:MAG: type II secretion system protein [Candidatus Roizmanbacteria bacterium]
MKKNNAFTLIELLVVISIIGIFFAISAFTYGKFIKSSRNERRKIDMEKVQSGLDQYFSQAGLYPTPISTYLRDQSQSNCESLVSLITPDSVAVPEVIIMDNIPVDPMCKDRYTYYYQPNVVENGRTHSYVVGAYMEGGTTTCSITGASCGVQTCNYCVFGN